MNIFNQFVSAFIGVLITLLPAPGAQSSLSADIAATSSSTATQVSALTQLRETLISLQSRFESANGHFARTEDDSEHATSSDSRSRGDDDGNDESDESDENEDRRTSASTSARIAESNSDISSSRKETSRHSENEEESEHDESDEDQGEHRSSSTVPPSQTPSTPVPAPQPATTPTYTTAQVAAHSTAASCYSIVNGSVYDLTRWISQHPGGSGAIKSMCGVDASAAFNGQHGGSARPASELSGFKIGTLAR